MSGKKLTWGAAVREHFPRASDSDVEFILWEMTCYPFSTITALEQIKALAEKVFPDKDGWEMRVHKQHEIEEKEIIDAMREPMDRIVAATTPTNPKEGE